MMKLDAHLNEEEPLTDCWTTQLDFLYTDRLQVTLGIEIKQLDYVYVQLRSGLKVLKWV